MNKTIDAIIKKYSADKTRLMDILIDTQDAFGFIQENAANQIANTLDISRVDLEQTISFYHFFSTKSRGKYTVYLNDSAVAFMHGRKDVALAFEKEAGCKFGHVSGDGLIGLFNTSCIGMNDQEPAAIINGTVFTRLTRFRVKEIIQDIRDGVKVENMFQASYGDGNNSLELINAVVNNHIMKKGPILSSDYTVGKAIKKIIKLNPEDVIEEVKLSNIRGRGGAGFPTGLKWDFCRKSHGDRRYIFCNADEGEPGTFKDRVIMTERPRLLFEGMTVAAYAVGASEGILYLRYEYKYLYKFMESILEEMRHKQLLGKNIGGKKGFDFDIRIQFGAGAYVCGEESALIESAEGKRGEPRDRPPFPVEKGYLGQPTIVNNVETLCSVVKVVLNGGEWYKGFGTRESTGTKLLSVSGDCRYPGVYEVEWGFAVNDILEMVGAEQVQGVQVGGPSGTCIGPNDFERTLGYEDLATGGSMIIINNRRDILKDIVLNFTDFFIEESCGSCTPCRTLPILMKNKLIKIIEGKGVMQDLMDIERWSRIMKANRCGLGHTALNPILSTLKNFRHLYLDKIQKEVEFDTGFRLDEAIKTGRLVTNRN
ncbi:MAG: NAD(P)H-dependent oxidoreductase subunit E [Cyclobacteriaceae bacterium]|nr:NAD(P)H-dependent oxidoreductase subunit E [Cyclobacteriaceae bacterium]